MPGMKCTVSDAAACWFGIVEVRCCHQRSCPTPSPVSTGMGDRVLVQREKFISCVTKHSGQFSLNPTKGGDQCRRVRERGHIPPGASKRGHQRSCPTPSPVSTGMGDRVLVQREKFISFV